MNSTAQMPLWLLAGSFTGQAATRSCAEWFLIFLSLVIWHNEALFCPPTYDQAKGIWFEGIFLAETNFDYHRLRHYEQSTGEGGAFVYFTSVLPTLIAFLIRLTPSPAVALLAYHLFNLACGAMIVWYVYRLLQSTLGKAGASLACAAMATSPPFQLQFSLVGMELPMIAFGVSSLVKGAHGHYVSSGMLGAAAAMVKFTGVLYLLAVIPVSLFATVTALMRREWRPAGWHFFGTILLCLVVLGMFRVFEWGGMDHLAARPIHVPID